MVYARMHTRLQDHVRGAKTRLNRIICILTLSMSVHACQRSHQTPVSEASPGVEGEAPAQPADKVPPRPADKAPPRPVDEAPAQPAHEVRPRTMAEADVDLFRFLDNADPAALEVPRQGTAAPLVAIVEFGSYECPHTREAEDSLIKMLGEFPEAARYFFHNPLPGHRRGYLLALAASAAHRQGKFWEMHSLLIDAPADINEDRLLNLARKAQVDIPLFLKDLKRDELKEHVERNRTVAAALSLTGTPVFLVNGRVVLGWPGEEKFRSLLKEELKEARARLAGAGSIRALHLELSLRYPPYRVLIEKGIKWDEPPVAAPQDGEPGRFAVSLDGAVWMLGPADALVTVVEFIDLTCPHSGRSFVQALQLAQSDDRLRFVFKLNPTRQRPEAEQAAVAAWAAGRAGRFVEFASAYFETHNMAEATKRACASVAAGCPTINTVNAEFQAALDLVKIEAVLVSAIGTPMLYVNGVRRQGFQETEVLKELLDREAEIARSLVRKGVDPKDVYTYLTGRGRFVSLLERDRVQASCDDCPHLGNEAGKTTMLVLWDFRSPFCRNLWPYLKRLHSNFGTSVSIRILPLVPEGDEFANLLGRAAACAWDMQAFEIVQQALFGLKSSANSQAVTRLAEQAGLNPLTFKQCLESPSTTARVQGWRCAAARTSSPGARSVLISDLASASQEGMPTSSAGGAPTVFIDGRKVKIPSGLDFHSLVAALFQAGAIPFPLELSLGHWSSPQP